MAGHSQFKNIMHRKGAQDAKRAKIFTKLIREITVATRHGGDDVSSNPRLRTAITAAKQSNMPKDKIEGAIKKGMGKLEGMEFIEITYEGYGPDNVAMMVECLTDNKNRASSDIRSIFTKHHSNFGPTEFLFNRAGLIVYPNEKIDQEILFDYAIEEGATDVIVATDETKITVNPTQLYPIAKKLAERFDEADFVGMAWLPKDPMELENTQKIEQFIDILEDYDDVQRIWTNI